MVEGVDLHLEPRSGMFTIVAVNRLDDENPDQKRLNKLLIPSYSDLLGEFLLFSFSEKRYNNEQCF